MRSQGSGAAAMTGGVACFILLGAALPAHAIISGETTASDLGIDYWFQQRGKNHPYVVKQFGFDTALEIESEDGVLTGINVTINELASTVSSANLVAPQYVLTAAHTVMSHGWMQYEIGGEIYRAEQWWTPAGYEQDELLFAQDIAVVRLDRPVDNVTPTTYIGRTDPADQLKSLDKKTFTMVGFGMADDLTEGFFDGRRRSAENRFDVNVGGGVSGGYFDQDLNLVFDLDLQGATPDPVVPGEPYDIDAQYPLPYEGMVMPGDSGGGSFVDDEIVGIHSYIYQLEDLTLYGASTDVRRFSTWINALVEHQDAGQGPLAFPYQTGLAGITIDDILSDLMTEDQVLVNWLVQFGYLDFSTMQGVSPFFQGFDWDTGLSFDDLEAARDAIALLRDGSLTAGPYTISDETRAILAELAGREYKLTDELIDEARKALIAFSLNQGFSLEEAELIARLNTIANPNMFGEGGTFGDRYTEVPEPASLAILLGSSVMMLRRRRA